MALWYDLVPPVLARGHFRAAMALLLKGDGPYVVCSDDGRRDPCSAERSRCGPTEVRRGIGRHEFAWGLE